MASEAKVNHDNDMANFSLDDDNFIYETTGRNEMVIFGASKGDRRQFVPDPSRDNTIIMRCIGRIESIYKHGASNKKTKCYVGTGTVFKVDQGWAYVITCAHNVRKKNDDGSGTDKPKSMNFVVARINKYGPYRKKYKMEEVAVHHYRHKSKDKNDLAILKFEDDGFYQKLFAQNKDNITLSCSDNIGVYGNQKYGIYGYPCPRDRHSNKNMKSGQLWGMMGDTRYNNGVKMYIRKNGEFWNYDAIDTEGGQSGSVIFISLGNNKYTIVGVHTTGSPRNNSGVALNKEKFNWIQNEVMMDISNNHNNGHNGGFNYAKQNNNGHARVNNGNGHNNNNGNRINKNNRQHVNQGPNNNANESDSLEIKINQLIGMGFEKAASETALDAFAGDLMKAIDLLSQQ